MNRLPILLLFLSSLALATGETQFRGGTITNGSAAVGTTNPAAASAAVDVVSTSKGFLPPRMTGTQRSAISSPATGLVVYNTTTNQLNVYNGSGWVSAGGAGGIQYAADTGSANAYAIAPSTAAVAYTEGDSYSFLSANANTGASTLNVSSLGTKPVKIPGQGALTAGDILANQIVTVVYDGTNFQMISPQGPATAANTASTIMKRDASGQVAATTFTGALSGNASTATSATSATSATIATTATNIAGGLGGSVPYQTAAGTTALLANGSSGQCYKSQGGTSSPQWGACASYSPTLPTASTAGATGSGTGNFGNSQLGWAFVLVTANATAGAVYTNNGHSFTVVNTVTNADDSDIFVTGTGSLSGTTLTKSSGTGDSSITFSTAIATDGYTPPTGYLYIDITMVGGGGGGGGGGFTGAGMGGSGSQTIFGCFGIDLNAGKGNGGDAEANTYATSDSNILNGATAIFSTLGGAGESGNDSRSTVYTTGAIGGSSCFGANGAGSVNNPGSTGQGPGGGGAGGGAAPTSGGNSGGGGSAGGCQEAWVTTPSLAACYYAVGVGGSQGGGGSGGFAGGAGFAGYIIAREHYQ